MSDEKKIGWQKYESLIEEQLSSTFMSDLFNKIAIEDEEVVEEDYEDSYDETAPQEMSAKIALNNKLIEDIGMITNFDCWIGHTNFDITPTVKKSLNNVGGIEVLKIFSRYRFFIGVGKMFDFKGVRYNIEDLLLNNKENDYGDGTGLEDSKSDE
jgi:hypothetical protein